MKHHSICYHTLQDHPLFLSSVVVNYHKELKHQSSINFGRVYFALLYEKFITIDCYGEKVFNPAMQLRPVSNYFSFSVKKGGKMVIVAMDSTRWFAISGEPASLYNERVLDLYEIFPRELLDSLYAQCAHTNDAKHVVEIFDEHLGSFYQKWQKPFPIDDIVDEIFECQGMIKLSDILKKYPFAKSTLGVYFKKYIGYSPNFFIRLIQFNNIIREVENNGSRLSELIRHYNFYDYAHFRKSFKTFTGVNPIEYTTFKKASMMEDVFKKIDYRHF
ncbi:helix-turn-helix domain-containing protein [Autumnicola edwardsiae]|uniref:Helix-turn-helix domain-containing protein n=1 Tax=Autumnicola edwardsiae TaxID=3075594 RepID=A0ABU3CT24_9FLAO|nr:helix-turn-helix domain-containing protein [Zunongwangia sp. F297]MDT0649436.1 helix-turn-helix domain-containing protein [Zunongwangia sp. F297]